MFPLFVSLLAAASFGIGAIMIYGPDATAGFAWVDQVFWGIVGAGVLVSLAGEQLRGALCRLAIRLTGRSLGCPPA